MLEGRLGDFSIAEILQLLAFTDKSGRLQLHGPNSTGRMIVVEGALVDVTADVSRVGVVRRLVGSGQIDPDVIVRELEEADELPLDREVIASLVADGVLEQTTGEGLLHDHALDALAEMLRWTEGSFHFEAEPQLTERFASLAATPSAELVEEANQRLAAWDDLYARLGSGDQVVSLAPDPSNEALTVPGSGWGLLRLVDGERTIDELSMLSGRGAYQTRKGLVELLDVGLIQLADSADALETAVMDTLTKIAELEARFRTNLSPPPHEPREPDAPRSELPRSHTPHDPSAREELGDAPPREIEVHNERAAHRRPDASESVPAQARARDDEVAPIPEAAELDEIDPQTQRAVQEFEASIQTALRAVEGGHNLTDRDSLSTRVHPFERTPRAPEPTRASQTRSEPGQASPLRARVRGDRLRTDPSIDAELVARLIDGVEEL